MQIGLASGGTINRRRIVHGKIFLWAALWTITTQTIFSEDAFYHLRLTDLNIFEGALPSDGNRNYSRPWEYFSAMHSYGALDGEGEIYVDAAGQQPWESR